MRSHQSLNCDCGATEKIVEHVVSGSILVAGSIYWALQEESITVLNNKTNNCLEP